MLSYLTHEGLGLKCNNWSNTSKSTIGNDGMRGQWEENGGAKGVPQKSANMHEWGGTQGGVGVWTKKGLRGWFDGEARGVSSLSYSHTTRFRWRALWVLIDGHALHSSSVFFWEVRLDPNCLCSNLKTL